MKRLLTLVAIILTTALFATQGASNANAGTFYFVSHNGSFANDCRSPGTACRTFDQAMTLMVDGDAISCVDEGIFGFPTVTKSITIDCLAGGAGANMQLITINA